MPTEINTEAMNDPYISTNVLASTDPNIPEDTVDLLELSVLLARRKRFILLSGLILALLTAGITLITKPTFTAKVDILPPKKSSSPLAQLGALSALAGGGGAASALGLKNPDDEYIGLLQSDTIADALIQHFQLESLYKKKFLSDTRKALAANTKIKSEKSGMISITFEDQDPKRAASIANAYVDELHDLMGHLAITEAGQRRLFFEQQLEHEKNKLADAEVALVATEQKTGIIQPAGQAQATIMSMTQLRAQIAASQIQLQALETSATPENPEVILLQTQIAGLESHLADLEKGAPSGAPGMQDDIIGLPSSKVPVASLEYVRKMRDVRYHETLFELLARQYEIAKVDEAKAGEIIQVVDPALVPDRKSWPPRTLLTILAGFLGILFASFWVIVQAAFQSWESDPERAAKLHELNTALRVRG
ncbi:MAG TPA: Wzz/FepE/Etk N-terminal domain-containing protein [Acidobacteriaceae bacterium]|nr:Wzz/FepE/Etk N-terminal domain-containing protein [Acidobacteriaceae bacterium]